MAISFYNQGDQDIYESGDHFIPQERFRLGYTAPPSIANAQTTSGITNTQAANPYLYPPQQGGGGGGLHNVYGYDPTKTKTFTKDVWSKTGPTEGWTTQNVTGYWSPSGWKTAKGKNINHAGLEVPTLMGTILDKWAGIKSGKKQVGDIKGTFTDSNWFGQQEEEDPIAVAALRRNLLNKIKAKAYKGPINVGGGGQDIGGGDPIGDVNTLGPNNPLIGKIDHTGGGDHGSITRDPGTSVEGAPSHSTRDDLMAQGGRIGLRTGGDPEEPAENIFEFMQDQNIPFGEMVEADPTEEQIAMVMDMDGRGMGIDEIMSFTQLDKETIMNILGVELAQGGIARLL